MLMAEATENKTLLLVSLTIVLVVTLTPGNGNIAGNYFDKVVHFTIFAFLAFAIIKTSPSNKNLSLYLFLAILLGFATEIAQQFIPGRNLSFYDALANTLGIFTTYLYNQSTSPPS